MKKPLVNTTEADDPINALMTLISEEVKKAENLKDADALKNWLELGASALEKFGNGPVTEEIFSTDAAFSLLKSGILLCDVIISGDDSAAGLKYNDENMFTPMIIFLEKNSTALALIRAAENLNVPVIRNPALAKNLSSYGKAGENIPDACIRDVSIVFTRLVSAKPLWHSRGTVKSRRRFPLKMPPPLLLELGQSLYALLGEAPGREKLLVEPLEAIRKRLNNLLGFGIQSFRIIKSTISGKDEYKIFFKGMEAGRGRVELGWYTAPHLNDKQQFIIPDITNNPEIRSGAAKAASHSIIDHVNNIVLKRAPELLGRDEVDAILNAAEEKYPVVTGEVKSLLSLGIIREILQSLVSEQVSIRHIITILETLADWGSFGTSPCEMIIEQIRQSLKRQICLDYTDEGMKLRVLSLESGLEKEIEDASPSLLDETGKSGAENSEEEERLSNLIYGAVKAIPGKRPVILCSPKTRPLVKEVTRRKLPQLAVLSYLEIPSDVNVVPLGEIGLDGKIRGTTSMENLNNNEPANP